MKQNEQYRLWCLAIANDDELAFNAFYKEFAPFIFRVAITYTGQDLEMAEELVQCIFIKIWEKRKKLAEVLSLEDFVFILSRNLIFDQLAKRSREKAHRLKMIEDVPADPATDNDPLQEKEYSILLEKAINQLPPQQKKVYILRKEQGMSTMEIADQINLTKSTVNAHLKYANRSVRKFIAHRLLSWLF